MAAQRATLYLDARLYRALKIKSATTDRPISRLVNEAVQAALKEDALDIEAFEKRKREPARPFDSVLRDLKRDGLL